MSVFVHEKAIVEGDQIGSGTRVWAFAHILPGAKVGRDCNICDNVFIENDVSLGDRVTVKCGVQLWDGVRVEDDVFIGPNVTFTNDKWPRSRQRPMEFSKTRIGKGASLGANSTILPGITIGANAMVGAGSVVTKSVPPNAVVRGNPARIAGYIDARLIETNTPLASIDAKKAPREGIALQSGARILHLPAVDDMRGSLSFGEVNAHLPFVPKRFFLVYDVPSERVRGEHAHRALHQFLVCTHGSVRVVSDNGRARDEVILDSPHVGLHLPPMIWGTQYCYTKDAVLLVLASDTYDPDDYIRDYDEFLKCVPR